MRARSRASSERRPALPAGGVASGPSRPRTIVLLFSNNSDSDFFLCSLCATRCSPRSAAPARSLELSLHVTAAGAAGIAHDGAGGFGRAERSRLHTGTWGAGSVAHAIHEAFGVIKYPGLIRIAARGGAREARGLLLQLSADVDNERL